MEGTLVKIRADVVTEGALVITCFPSVGMVSSVVGHYLIDNLELEFVGGVVDPRLPPLTLVSDGKPMPIITPMLENQNVASMDVTKSSSS